MKHRLSRLILALTFPILVLAYQTWTHHQQREAGEIVTLPIQGFDPRDLLSGHYLTYQVDFGIDHSTGCPTSDIAAAVCLQPERRVYPLDELPEKCTQFIRGNCDNSGQFVSGIERFYVPEAYAEKLDQKVRDNRGTLVISVDKAGNAGIRDLLIEGRSWQEIITP